MTNASIAAELIARADLIDANGANHDSELLRRAARALTPRARNVAPSAVPVVNTGDFLLDEWMRRQYARGVKPFVPKPHPVEAALKPRKWTARELDSLHSFNEFAVAAWRRLGHKVVITGGRVDNNGANVRVLPLALAERTDAQP